VQDTSHAQTMATSGELAARGSDAIEILVNDHQVIKGLLTQLTSGAIETRKDTLDQLKGVLTIHNATEENLVYPALAVVGGNKSDSEQLFHETAEADTAVFELDMVLKQADDAAFSAKAKTLQAAILEHIQNEEDKAFPHLQKHADAAQTQQLTQDVREYRNAIRFVKATG
jgi:hemerythrin superfamily protein